MIIWSVGQGSGLAALRARLTSFAKEMNCFSSSRDSSRVRTTSSYRLTAFSWSSLRTWLLLKALYSSSFCCKYKTRQNYFDQKFPTGQDPARTLTRLFSRFLTFFSMIIKACLMNSGCSGGVLTPPVCCCCCCWAVVSFSWLRSFCDTSEAALANLLVNEPPGAVVVLGISYRFVLFIWLVFFTRARFLAKWIKKSGDWEVKSVQANFFLIRAVQRVNGSQNET